MEAKTRTAKNQNGILAMTMPDGCIMVIERGELRNKLFTFERMSDFVNHPLASRVMTSEVVDVEFWEE